MTNSKLLIVGIISTLASGIAGAAQEPNQVQKDIRGQKETCKTIVQKAINQCQTEFDSGIHKLLASKSKKGSADIQVERTSKYLCELEAKRDYDYCQIAANFENTNFVEVIQENGVELRPVLSDDVNDLEEIVPSLSGSNYRSLSMLCDQLPGGDATGSRFHAWTGVNLSYECSNDVWEACMNDPEMGSNAVGTAPNPDHASEREQNCFEAMYMYHIPVI